MIKLFQGSRFRYIVCFLVFVVSLAPVLCFRFFPTVDGPSHLYNATIIRELWCGNAHFYADFFEFNPVLVPNWTGHLLAVFSGIFLPVWLVEKLLVITIVTGLPISLLMLARSFGSNNGWGILLLLPFTYTLTLYLGFFNFLISLVLLFLVIAFWRKWKTNSGKWNFLMSAILIVLTYFSHPLSFAFALAFIVMMEIWEKLINKEYRIFTVLNLVKFSTFIPAAILFIRFFSISQLEGFHDKIEHLPNELLWKWMKEGMPLIGLTGAVESGYTSAFMAGIGILVIFLFVIRLKSKFQFLVQDVLLIFSLMLLVMFFVVPDGMFSGGFISLRLLLMSMLFAIIWILVQKSPSWLMLLAGGLGVYVSFATFSYRMETTSELSRKAENMIQLANAIKPGSVVLPLSYSTNWLHINLSGYAGATNNLIILDNYEAVEGIFPLIWKKGMAPGLSAGNFTQSLNPVITPEKYEAETGKKIDAIIRWQYNKETTDSISIATSNKINTLFTSYKVIGEGEIFY